MLVFATFKEGWWDPIYEDPITEGSDLEDFIFYLFGIMLANVFLIFKIKGA
jgi:hypothetical protein